MHGPNGNDFILRESNPFIIRINKYLRKELYNQAHITISIIKESFP